MDNTVYALDSSTIDLCPTLFPWADFRKTKAAVKLHTLLDLRGSIPSFIHISDGKLHDVNVMDLLIPEAGAFYVMDRAYVDFARLYTPHQAHAFFVVRAKSNTKVRRLYSRLADRAAGVVCDQTIVLTGVTTPDSYPEKLRRIKFHDAERGKTLIWIAVSVYVLIAIIDKRLHLDASLYTILQILSVAAFERMPLEQLLAQAVHTSQDLEASNQLNLFD